MALFFDQDWFDGELARLHMRRADLGVMLGLDEAAIGEVWKDQRELKADDVALIAALFNRPAAEIALHAGIATPVPKSQAGDGEARLAAIETKLDEILTLLRRLNP